jgi:hypothetical protein
LGREAGVAGISAWRANDVVEYDAMRDSATLLTALLLRESNAGTASGREVQADIDQLRKDVLTVDGYDRAAVAALAARIRSRVAEMS